MKKRIMFTIIYFMLSLIPVFGQNQEILPLSSEIYDEIDALYLMRGLGTPSSARPWTLSEARLILGRLENHSFNRQEQALYDHIAAEIYRPLRFSLDDAFSFDLGLNLNLEAYAHTNTSDYVLSEDWNYGYEKRQPLVKLSLEMNLFTWMNIFTDLQYNRGRFNIRDERRNVQDLNGIGAVTSFSEPYNFPWRSWAYSNSFLTNIQTRTDEFDFDWPKRANITFGGRHWNLSLARDRIQWGRGHTGNFIFDSHRDYDEYFRFSAFSDKFKYEWLNVFYPDPEKLFMAHRLEFRILPILVFSISENIMCRLDNFNLRNINPSYIFHNWYDRDNFNSLANLEIDIVPFKGYRLYTQAVIDQVQAPWESDSEAPAWGILAGIENARPAGPGILTLSLEGAYTTPLLYRRDSVDFITIDYTYVSAAFQNLNLDYTAYPYGPDAIVFQFDAHYLFPAAALIHARLFSMIHGKMNFFVSHNEDGNNNDYANLKDHTPSGEDDEREYTFGITLGGNYTFPRFVSWLKMYAWTEFDYIFKKNKLMISETGINEDIVYHKQGISMDFQFIFGIGIRL